ncbi:MAG: ABC transporter ATP-binding protein [Thermoplasmata archaeon]|nr:ABC transporter ATP-binding protein [Thermoplasmata archaeon]
MAESKPAGEAFPELAADTTTATAASAPLAADTVLDVRNLRTYFFTYDGVVKALDGVTFSVRRGETLGLVGETGCGKSVTAFSVTRLIADPPGRIMDGTIRFRGANLLWNVEKEATYKPIPKSNRIKVTRRFREIKANLERLVSVRGGGISMIFQEPMSAMNPIFSISNQIGEAILLHRGIQLLDGLLLATPDAPEVAPAVEAVMVAARTGDGEKLRVACRALGEAVHLPSVGTEAYYIFRGAPNPDKKRDDLEDAIDRLRISGFHRRYLKRERRLQEIQKQLKLVYFDEMKNGRLENARRGAIRRKRLQVILQSAYFELWGIRGWSRRPIEEELVWQSVRLLEGVSIANPVQVARGYPHELSGGMLQRVMIAMALSAEPELLIADEPTTALDVTVQMQILELMRELKQRIGTAILLITHDLGVIAEVADRLCVMYAGNIVEVGTTRDVFHHPLHPYTQGLLASIPRIDDPDRKLESIPGSVPNLITPPPGCRFHPRCPQAMPICKEIRPPVTQEGPEHTVACHLYHGPVVRRN